MASINVQSLRYCKNHIFTDYFRKNSENTLVFSLSPFKTVDFSKLLLEKCGKKLNRPKSIKFLQQ